MIEEIINEEPTFEEYTKELVEQFKKADHFYIIHYCKKRDDIEKRRCYWDEKSKIWLTKNDKLAIEVETKANSPGLVPIGVLDPLKFPYSFSN